MAKRKMYGSAFSRRLETLGTLLSEQNEMAKRWDPKRAQAKANKIAARRIVRECKARIDALAFALDVLNDLVPTKVAYEVWGGKLLELSLQHSYTNDGKLLVYATLCDYTACAKPPHDERCHVMRIDSEEPLGTYEPRTANNALWLDMIAGMDVCGVFGVVETVREPKALAAVMAIAAAPFPETIIIEEDQP